MPNPRRPSTYGKGSAVRVRLKGINSKRKTLADGTVKTYYWLGKAGPRIEGEPGTLEVHGV